MRHTHATWLPEAGVPLHVVAERLDHKDAMVTATIYAQVTGKQSRAASVSILSGFWLPHLDSNQKPFD